jgi:hypothetical protein
MQRSYEGQATLTVRGVEVSGTLFLTIFEEEKPMSRGFRGQDSRPVGTPWKNGDGSFVADTVEDIPHLDPPLDQEICPLRFEDCGKRKTVSAFVDSTDTAGTLRITLR